MLPNQYRRIVGCDVDSELLAAAKADLVLSVPAQVLNSKSGISGSEKVKAVAKVFEGETAALQANEKASVCV